MQAEPYADIPSISQIRQARVQGYITQFKVGLDRMKH